MTGRVSAGRVANVPRRIFWLGMHKVLVETEFKLLQRMGYEVFRPPYLTDIVDQSVSHSPDFGNAVLPDGVRELLSSYNFFYNPITPEIGELLEEHFDAVLVTINPDWLKEVLLAVPARTVIYRTYGHLGRMSESLAYNGCDALIAERNSKTFHFLPHAPECIADEEPWLAERATVVPYWLTDDVLALRGQWQAAEPQRSRSMGLICPNITNPYYTAHFRYLKRYFEERCYRYYGVQIEPNADLNVVGTLPRTEQLARLARESGFLYTYRERNVCYLPPIEMMTMGGPVLYFPGCLLARYFNGATPGLVRDEAEAVTQARRLIRGDRVLADEIIDSQAGVAYRYTPEYGEALFRLVLDRIVPLAPVSDGPSVGPAAQPDRSPSRVLLFAHFGGYIVEGTEVAAIHGIPRVMRQLVRALNDHRVPVSVTHGPSDRDATLRFYAAACANPELVDAVDAASVVRVTPTQLQQRYGYAIVPHYHHFPEANLLQLPILAYVPDYLPHFFRGRGWFDEPEADIECGRSLVALARHVLTCSSFSAAYLPHSRLNVPEHKIRMFPLPFLGSGQPRPTTVPRGIPAQLASEPFVFYPTQPHPHKRLDLLVMAWLLLNGQRSLQPPVRLVLTTGELPARLIDLIAASRLSGQLHLLPTVSDATLEWLYASARCLAFSSELEGNFPTQVLEALHLDCPVVCTDNPLILAELGESACFLQVAPFGDVQAFADRMAWCVEHRDEALDQQRLVKPQMLDRFSYARFRAHVDGLHRLMTKADVGTAPPESQPVGALAG